MATEQPQRLTRARTTIWAWALGVAAIVLVLDQTTKQLAVNAVDRGDRHELMFGIEITNVRNRGVAFGLFANGDLPVLAFTLVTLTVPLLYFYRHSDRPGLWLAVG